MRTIEGQGTAWSPEALDQASQADFRAMDGDRTIDSDTWRSRAGWKVRPSIRAATKEILDAFYRRGARAHSILQGQLQASQPLTCLKNPRAASIAVLQ